jgi:hypothetical protein
MIVRIEHVHFVVEVGPYIVHPLLDRGNVARHVAHILILVGRSLEVINLTNTRWPVLRLNLIVTRSHLGGAFLLFALVLLLQYFVI